MSKGIKLSEKHGLNPTIPVCFFCGEPKNEIALLGKIGGRGEDLQAPMHAVIDYEPCDKCKEAMEQGITMIGVVTEPIADGRPPITRNKDMEFYPTGTWAVVSEDFIKNHLNSEELIENILRARSTIADDAIVRDLCEQIAEMQKEEE